MAEAVEGRGGKPLPKELLHRQCLPRHQRTPTLARPVQLAQLADLSPGIGDGWVRPQGREGNTDRLCKPADRRKKDEAEEKESWRFILRYSTVFNIDQCDGLPAPAPTAPLPEIEPIAHCEQIVSNWNNRPTLNLERPTEARAFYRPSTDTVHMPMRNRFVDAEHYYSTLFHELVHSTGHASRLNREFGLSFGDDLYSREELVAEMGAAFLCAIAGISNERTEKNTAAYLQNWISVLKGIRALWFKQLRRRNAPSI